RRPEEPALLRERARLPEHGRAVQEVGRECRGLLLHGLSLRPQALVEGGGRGRARRGDRRPGDHPPGRSGRDRPDPARGGPSAPELPARGVPAQGERDRRQEHGSAAGQLHDRRMRAVRRAFSLLALGVTLWTIEATGRTARHETAPAAADEALVQKVCSGCHVVPPPDVLPRASWRRVAQGMAGMIMGNVGPPPGPPPLSLDFDVERIVRYYEARAPGALPPPEPWPAPDPARFVRHAMSPKGVEGPPLVANVRFL